MTGYIFLYLSQTCLSSCYHVGVCVGDGEAAEGVGTGTRTWAKIDEGTPEWQINCAI